VKTENPSAVFLNRQAAARYRALASVIPDPRLIEKRIFLAEVWQSLRTTALVCNRELYNVPISDSAVVNVIKRDCNQSVNESNHPN
jgi:hypothetical protein